MEFELETNDIYRWLERQKKQIAPKRDSFVAPGINFRYDHIKEMWTKEEKYAYYVGQLEQIEKTMNLIGHHQEDADGE